MNTTDNLKTRKIDITKFIIMSAIGAFLFLVPIPRAEGAATIPLGIIIGWLEGQFGRVILIQEFGIQYILMMIAISVSFVGTALAYTIKPNFIMDHPRVKAVFGASPLYFISRGIAFIVVWMIFLDMGPNVIMNLITSNTGDVMFGLAAHLMVLFLVLVPIMPILTSFGLMEFAGILIRKFVRFLFVLPGRASVNLLASWFGSSGAGIIITRDQHEKGFYTGREAAIIATNFCHVSLPFTFVIASTVDVLPYFGWFYLILCIVCLFLAILMPRIWPLRGLADNYLEETGKQIDEQIPEGTSMFGQALSLASNKARQTTVKDIVDSSLKVYMEIFMDIIPILIAWGTLSLIIGEFTPIIDWVSRPMGWYLQLLNVPGALQYAPATLIGFIEMFIPAFVVAEAPIATRFILGILSIVQIIYLAETGSLIIKSRIPLNIGKLFIIFMMRTIIALPIIVLLTRLFLNF